MATDMIVVSVDNPWPKYGLMWMLNRWPEFDVRVYAAVILILRLLGETR